MHSQPRFSVLASVLAVFVLLAVATKVLKPFESISASRRLALEEPVFLSQASGQAVDWYPLSAAAFDLAFSKNLPILLVVGAPWSLTGRQVDAVDFSSISVVRRLRRDFVCIRVDALETPDWAAAYLPFQRAALRILPDFQMWVLDPRGRLVCPLDSRAPGEFPSETEMVDDLDAAIRTWRAQMSQSGAEAWLGPGAAQYQQLAGLSLPPRRLSPDLAAFTSGLLDEAKLSPDGGFPVGKTQLLWPDAWSYLAAVGGAGAAETSLDPLLRSPARDLVDGGFFRGSLGRNWRSPMYDKVAVPNAEMCLVLAQLYARTGEPAYRAAADEDFDSLDGEFLDTGGMIRPCRLGDESGDPARSARSSFSPAALRRLFPRAGPWWDVFAGAPDRIWARKRLDLRVEDNPAMTPRLTDLALDGSPRYEAAMAKLRSNGPKPAFDPEITLDTCATSAARLMQAARILGDAPRMARAELLYERLDAFRFGPDVVHEEAPSPRAQATFGDYLAYADASLQEYLSLGRTVALDAGLLVLRRGVARFGGLGYGAFRAGLSGPFHALAPDSDSPELFDSSCESQTARAIRLCWCYGTLFSLSADPSERRAGASLLAASSGAEAQFADLAAALPQYLAGYASACALIQDATVAFCTGPRPDEMAQALSRREPFRLVVPVSDPVPKGAFGKPGYYIRTRGALAGPFSLDAAAARLAPTLQVGVAGP